MTTENRDNTSSIRPIQILLCLFLLSAFSSSLYAQSEEDILNSIGAELEAEADAKEKQAEVKKQYDALKAKADGYFKGGKFDKAKPIYEEMDKLIPDSDYPKRQIRLIKQKIEEAKEAEVQAEYDKLIAEADALFGKEKWTEAKAKYAAAAKVKPGETYPSEKTKAIAKLIEEKKKAEEAAKIQAQYDGFIKTADEALASKNFEVAKSNYQQATKVKPTEKYPKDQILAVAKAIKEEEDRKKQEAKDKQYNDLIAAADEFLAKQQWDQAKVKYSAALKVKPNESYPKDQLSKTDQLKAESEKQAQEAAIQKQYDEVIKQADNFFKLKNWDAAIAKYNEALKIKQDTYPTTKIAEAEQEKVDEAEAAQQAEIDQKYKQAIGVADNLLSDKKYEEAIAKYNEAKSIKPSEGYPDEQISKAKSEIAAKEEADKAAQVLAQYKDLVASADDLMAAKNYSEAIAKYNEAKAVKSDESYPDTQIGIANQAIADAEKAAAKAEKLDADYFAALNAASEALVNKNFDEAIQKFEEAGTLKPSESEPKDGLKDAKEQKKFAEAEAKKAAEEQAALEAKEAEYQKIISNADAAKTANDFVNAKALYKQASGLKPSDNYPADQIKAIDAEIAAAAQAEKEAAEAALQEEAELEENYQALLAKGDEALSQKNYEEAILSYGAASKLKPSANTPQERINEVNRVKEIEEAALAKEEEDKAAALEAEAAYKDLLAKADQAFQAENWPTAKNLYRQALSEKTTDEYPQKQLAAIDALIAQINEEAEAQAAAEAAAKEQLEADYQKYMALGAQAADAEDYRGARDAYEKAAEIKPSASGPADGLAEVDRLENAAIAAAEQLKKKEKQDLENQYSALMSQGEEALRNKQWDNARNFFSQASALKPEAFGAKERIQEVDRLEELDKVEAKKAEEAERAAAEKQSEFDATMAMGDEAMSNESYQAAIGHFQKALDIIPSSGPARDKLRQAQDLLAEQIAAQDAAKAEEAKLAAEKAAKEAAEAEALRKAEEEARLAAEAAAAKAIALDEQFALALAAGDEAMASRKYKEAVEAYEQAQAIKPEDSTIGSKLTNAQERLSAQAEKQAERRRAEEAVKRKEMEAARQKAAELAEKRRQERIKRLQENTPEELAKRYPSGVTEETIDQGYRTVKRTVVVEQGKGRQLHEIDYPWGLKFYYLNGKRVTQDAYKQKVEVQK